jgi:hypothetical protein
MANKKANPHKAKPEPPVHHSSEVFVNRFPFLYSKTVELVWKWEQSKLCGLSINTTLQTESLWTDNWLHSIETGPLGCSRLVGGEAACFIDAPDGLRRHQQ